MIDSNETPEEKAKRLGLPIKPSVEWPSKKFERDDYMQDFLKARKPDAICGGCGREIFNTDFNQPCGRQNCPFGTIYYHNSIL